MGIWIYVRAFLILKLCLVILLGVNFYKIMRLDCYPYLQRKIKIHDIGHDHRTRFGVYHYNVPFYSKSKSHKSFFYQSIHIWNSMWSYENLQPELMTSSTIKAL